MAGASLSTASEVSRALRGGEASAIDVVEAQLDRMARGNPPLNAIVTLDADGARRRAREADRALSDGIVWGPSIRLCCSLSRCRLPASPGRSPTRHGS